MKKIYKLENLDCAVCAQKIEDGVKKVDGVADVSVSFMAQKIAVDFSFGVDENKVKHNIEKTCKKIEPGCVIKW